MKTQAPSVNASCSASLPDTRNYKVVRGGKNCEQSYENTFRSIFNFPLRAPSHYFQPLIAAGQLREQFFLLMLAVKSCPAQLRHQKVAMTARPHADRVTDTGSQKECFHSSVSPPVGVNSIKPSSLTNTPSSSSQDQFTQFQAFTMTSALRCCWSLISLKLFLTVLIFSVISSSFPLCFPHITAVLSSRRCCFTYSPANPDHSALRRDQQESVNNAYGHPYVKLRSEEEE